VFILVGEHRRIRSFFFPIHNIRLYLGKVAVVAQLQDLKMRQTFENAFVQKLKDSGTDAVAAVDILPPFRRYSNEEIAKAFSDNQVDTILLLVLTDAYSQKSYVPPSSSTTSTSSIYGNMIYGSSRTTTSGGYYVSEPRMRFEADAVLADSGDVMWKATTFTIGDEFAETDTIADSLSTEVVKQFLSRSAPQE
jgi:hypothetical protein